MEILWNLFFQGWRRRGGAGGTRAPHFKSRGEHCPIPPQKKLLTYIHIHDRTQLEDHVIKPTIDSYTFARAAEGII